jgi:NAD(P)-dependent dehydrogenase (short-subunit alcohol dehydrogenase family)
MTVGIFEIRDRVAIVTGAASGLGARFAQVLHAHGARVVIAARREERLQRLAEELGRDNVLVVPTDMTDDAAVSELVERAVARFGSLDIVVNSAGAAFYRGPAVAEPATAVRKALDINLTAVFVSCQASANVMLAQGRGSIINLTSVLAIASGSDFLPAAGYVASKGGVLSLTRELAAQWAAGGVRVNAIAPGFFPSELNKGLVDPAQIAWIRQRTPMARPGEPHELDGAVLFLASDASSYVTGQILVVDGGWSSL